MTLDASSRTAQSPCVAPLKQGANVFCDRDGKWLLNLHLRHQLEMTLIDRLRILLISYQLVHILVTSHFIN
jgi:hypothetical protein